MNNPKNAIPDSFAEINPNNQPDLSVVIVSYNTCAMTLECLETLYRGLQEINAEVWLVDNASTDNTIESMASDYPAVHVIANGENVGFGVANNQAMERAAGRYVLLLNSDAFPEPDSITQLVRYLDEHPKVGVVGPRLVFPDGRFQRSCFRFPSPWQCWLENLWITRLFSYDSPWGDYRRWPHDRELIVDFVIGACMLVRREVIEEVGGFDPNIFMYAEEAEWQRRISEAGWSVAFTPVAQVTHRGGASGKSEPVKIRNSFFESQDYYTLKHHGVRGLIAMRLAMVLGCAMRSVLWTGAFLLKPSHRTHAASKVRLHLWLVKRQLLDWAVRGPAERG